MAAAKEDSKTKASGSNKQKGKAVSSKARKKPVLCRKARGNAKDTTLQEKYAKVIQSIAKKVTRTEPLTFKRNKSPWTRNNTCVFCVGVCKECGTHLYAGPWAKAHNRKWGSVQRLKKIGHLLQTASSSAFRVCAKAEGDAEATGDAGAQGGKGGGVDADKKASGDVGQANDKAAGNKKHEGEKAAKPKKNDIKDAVVEEQEEEVEEECVCPDQPDLMRRCGGDPKALAVLEWMRRHEYICDNCRSKSKAKARGTEHASKTAKPAQQRPAMSLRAKAVDSASGGEHSGTTSSASRDGSLAVKTEPGAMSRPAASGPMHDEDGAKYAGKMTHGNLFLPPFVVEPPIKVPDIKLEKPANKVLWTEFDAALDVYEEKQPYQGFFGGRVVLMKRNARMDLQLGREVRKAVDFVRPGRAKYRCVHHPTHFLVRASMLSDPELAKIKYDIVVRPAFDRGPPEP